VTDGFEQR